MKAAVLVGLKKVEIQNVPRPEPGPEEVVVRVREAGICGSDYSLFTGKLTGRLPVIPGHEAVGEIAAVGPDVQGFRSGERVTFQPNFSCGECSPCRKGLGNICSNKIRLGIDVDGGFAEYVRVPQKYLWRLPDGLSDSQAALTEPLAVAVHGHRKGQPAAGEKILIYGTGVIGLLYLQLAVLAGGEVTAFDIVEPRLDIARRLGAKRTVQSLNEMEKEAGTFSLIYEISGVPGALSDVVKLCAPGGRAVFTGLPDKEFPVLTTPIVRKELTLMGAMIYTDEFGEAIDLLRTGKINAQPLISESYPLEGVQEALEGFGMPQRVKTLIHLP